jgi:hypothetical protein
MRRRRSGFSNTPAALAIKTAEPGYAATPMINYKSYAQFASDVAADALPAGTWVMYDNEDWTYTPIAEQQQPAKYMKSFATLAHLNGLKVIEVPARDLVNVTGASCVKKSSETLDAAYLRCQLPADGRYADIFSIQSQGDQADVADYQGIVKAAATQVRAVTPSIGLMAGLTTDRGDTPAEVVAAWQATHPIVSAYWMNTTSDTVTTAEQALDQIRCYGG